MNKIVDWRAYVDSQVSAQYVSPLMPKAGETVTLSIRIPSESPVTDSFLVAFVLGRTIRFQLRRDSNVTGEQERKTSYWRASLRMPNIDGLYWWFELKADDTILYYAAAGFLDYSPAIRDCFRLEADLQVPDWIPGGVCYQIFPDRFRKGDPSVGVRPGEYEFDGAKPQVLGWNEKPLEFAQGRCLDFYNGDLRGIADSVEHFVAMGVSVLYLNPIGVSRTIHRYDCCDFFHVDEKLGGDQALIELIEVMHEHGIKVVVDISINHTGTDHPWFLAAQKNPQGPEAAYYYKNEDGSFAYWEGVPTLPQLNYGSMGLRELMYRGENSVMRKFLKPPFNQDGWRLDVADVVGRRGEDQFCHEIWREVRTAVKETKPQAYLVAEDWVDASSHLQGDEWDAAMNYYGSSRPIRRWVGETDRFQLPGWGHYPVPGSYFSGIDLADALDRQLRTLPAQLLFQQFNLIDSHDTPRLHNNHLVYDWDVYRGAVMLLYMLPGIPNVYYGDEIGLDGEIGSVEASRYPMQWNEGYWRREYWELYRRLGELKRSEPALAYGAWKILHADRTSLVFARYDGERAVVLLLNKSARLRTLRFNASALIPAQAVRWSDGTRVDVSPNGEISVGLAARESEILLLRQL